MSSNLGWPARGGVAETFVGWPDHSDPGEIDPSGDVGGPGEVSRETSPYPTDPLLARLADVSRETIPSRSTSRPEAGRSDTVSSDSPRTPAAWSATPPADVAEASPEPAPYVRAASEAVAEAGIDTVVLNPTAPQGAGIAPVTTPAALSEQWPAPPKTRLLTVANQKGGVGKTTTTVNLAVALAQHGLRVLVVDLDPQGNASTAFGLEHQTGIPSIYDVLIGARPLHEVVAAVPNVANLWCTPATIDLAGAEIELVSMVARESRLRKALDGALENVDYVLIDCPPSLGLLTLNAMVAAGEMLIPIQCEFYALEGLSQLLNNIGLVKNHLNPDLHVSTILLTMYDARTRLADQVAAEVREHFGSLVLESVIPRSVRISEAPGFGQTVMTFDPSSRGARAYEAAAYDLARRGQQEGA